MTSSRLKTTRRRALRSTATVRVRRRSRTTLHFRGLDREPNRARSPGPAPGNDAAELVRHGGVVVITWTDGSTLTITPDANWLNYSFRPGSDLYRLTGLLATGDGKPGDLLARDGTVLTWSDHAYSTKLYTKFGDSWRIRQTELLFDYRPGRAPRRSPTSRCRTTW